MVVQITMTCHVAPILMDIASKTHLKLSHHTGSETFCTAFVV